jgi:hypothetical protein
MSVEIGEGRTHVVAQQRDVAQEEQRGSGALVAAVRDVRLLLISLWAGAAVFFSAAVAPSAFVSIVNTGGFIISLLLLASAFLFSRRVKRRAFYAEITSLMLLGITTALGQWVIAAKMLALRASLGRPIDQVAEGDPLRVAFNSLHGYSVTALAVGIVASVVARLLVARRAHK